MSMCLTLNLMDILSLTFAFMLDSKKAKIKRTKKKKQQQQSTEKYDFGYIKEMFNVNWKVN